LGRIAYEGLESCGTPIKVMAVDDSPITRKMIRKALEPEGLKLLLKWEWQGSIGGIFKSSAGCYYMDVTML
jgi:two-component system chemotaxis response regulator CheY